MGIGEVAEGMYKCVAVNANEDNEKVVEIEVADGKSI